MPEDWLTRWEEGRIGWHEAEGNSALRQFWPRLVAGSRVLVPLCGKSSDLLFLAREGYDVTGVELSDIAVKAFFEDNDLAYSSEKLGSGAVYRSHELNLSVVCGDYFDFRERGFDALYDRASLVALPPQIRPAYVRHTRERLRENASQLLITLEYDQDRAGGPPYAVWESEVLQYWPHLSRIAERNDIADAPPKFRNAGISDFIEVVWATDRK